MFFYILFSKPMAAEMPSVNNAFVVGPSVQAFLYCHYKPFVAALQVVCSGTTSLLNTYREGNSLGSHFC